MMLVIRAEQVATLQAALDRPVLEWIARFLRRHEPALVEEHSPETLITELEHTWSHASRFGIADPVAVAEFFVARALHGVDFDRHPEVRAVLEDGTLPPDARIHALWRHVPARRWAELDARPCGKR
jgi:hypothetical protein